MSAKGNERFTVRFKLCGVHAYWLEGGLEKADWTRLVTQTASQLGKQK